MPNIVKIPSKISSPTPPTPTTPEEKDVNFYDYDGTLLYSYTAQEFLALTTMPTNPSHDGLIAQGWNWDLSDAQDQVAEYGVCDIGQMYVTESGATEIDIELYDERLSPQLAVAINGTVEIDWGDNTSDQLSGTSITTQKQISHTYQTGGKYTIKISAISGEYSFGGNNSYFLLNSNSTSSANTFYTSCIHNVRLGLNVAQLNTSAFRYCSLLQTITMTNAITKGNTYMFDNCKSLLAVVIPKGFTITNSNSSMFSNCYAIKHILLPLSFRYVPSNMCQYCYSLEKIIMPYNVSSTGGSSAFQYCNCLRKINIPKFSSISSSMFNLCLSLLKVTIPNSVSSISGQAFASAYAMKEIHFKKITPPTVANNTFSNLPTDCIIYVPAGTLSAYTSAANYPSSSTYTYIEE